MTKTELTLNMKDLEAHLKNNKRARDTANRETQKSKHFHLYSDEKMLIDI